MLLYIMSIFYKPSKETLNELDNRLKESTIKLNTSTKRLNALKEFKERTGLKGQELKKAFDEYWNDGNPKSNSDIKKDEDKPKKTYKESNIMKGRSDLKKTKSGKMAVETELNVRKNLEPKVKRALKKSIIEEVNKKIKGGTINLDYSSSSDEHKSDSESDEEDTKEYSKMLSQLINHIKNKKEPIDKKKIVDTIVKKKRGRPRKN